MIDGIQHSVLCFNKTQFQISFTELTEKKQNKQLFIIISLVSILPNSQENWIKENNKEFSKKKKTTKVIQM